MLLLACDNGNGMAWLCVCCWRPPFCRRRHRHCQASLLTLFLLSLVLLLLLLWLHAFHWRCCCFRRRRRCCCCCRWCGCFNLLHSLFLFSCVCFVHSAVACVSTLLVSVEPLRGGCTCAQLIQVSNFCRSGRIGTDKFTQRSESAGSQQVRYIHTYEYINDSAY